MRWEMSGLITSIGDAIEWEHRQVLRVSPKNPASATDVEIGPDDRWAFFDLAINFRSQTDTEKVLIHGTSMPTLGTAPDTLDLVYTWLPEAPLDLQERTSDLPRS